MFYIPYWWVTIPGILLGFYAQARLSSTFGKYSQIGSQSGLTGAEAAREILDRAGLPNMPVLEEASGYLSDHFDPVKKALFLSSENYHGRSIAAIGVAAHEAGHALQQKAAYALFNFRMTILPATQFANFAFLGLIFLGVFLHAFGLLLIGIIIFAVTTVFQVVTLPVEYDASRRAKEELLRLGLVQPGESAGVSSVLNAAALTYVAAMVVSILQLLQYVMLFNRRERD
jgi:Zn-dependent membrane protease YugP